MKEQAAPIFVQIQRYVTPIKGEFNNNIWWKLPREIRHRLRVQMLSPMQQQLTVRSHVMANLRINNEAWH